jgi:hypothetical protein
MAPTPSVAWSAGEFTVPLRTYPMADKITPIVNQIIRTLLRFIKTFLNLFIVSV